MTYEEYKKKVELGKLVEIADQACKLFDESADWHILSFKSGTDAKRKYCAMRRDDAHERLIKLTGGLLHGYEQNEPESNAEGISGAESY